MNITYQQLKDCKTLKEIFTILPDDFYEKACTALLGLFCLTPVIMIPLIFLLPGYDIPNFYLLVTLPLHLCVLFSLWMILGQFILHGNLLRKHFQKAPWELFFGIMLIWALIGVLLSEDIMTSLAGSFYRGEGWLSYLGYAGVFICASRIKSDRRKTMIFHLILFSSLCQGVLLGLHLIFPKQIGPFLDNLNDSTFTAVFFHQNHMGYYLSIAIAIAAGLFLINDERKKSVKYLVCLGILVWELVVNTTRGSYIGVLVSIILAFCFFSCKEKKMYWKGLLPVAVLFGVSLLTAFNQMLLNFIVIFTDLKNILLHKKDADAAGSGRWILWKKTLILISKKPVFGYGIENLHPHFVLLKQPQSRPANEYLQYAAEMGIPALLFYLGGLISLAIHHLRKLRELSPLSLVAAMALISYAVSAFFGNSTLYVTPYFWMMVAFTAQG